MRPLRSPQYLAWIRTQRCVVCGAQRGIEASHTGPHGLGQKSADTTAIPLCSKHHRTGNDSYHRLGPRRFAQVHNLDVAAIVRWLNLKPAIKIETGRFVGYLGNQQFLLGDTSNGVAAAVRKMVRICSEDRLGLMHERLSA